MGMSELENIETESIFQLSVQSNQIDIFIILLVSDISMVNIAYFPTCLFSSK